MSRGSRRGWAFMWWNHNFTGGLVRALVGRPFHGGIFHEHSFKASAELSTQLVFGTLGWN